MTSSELARRILQRGALTSHDARESATPETAISALQRSCIRVTDTLHNSIGEAGCAALLARALARTERAHPLLRDLRPSADEVLRLDGIASAAVGHDIEPVTAAIEALLAAVIDILARLVGDDMAIRLVDNDGLQPPTRGGVSGP